MRVSSLAVSIVFASLVTGLGVPGLGCTPQSGSGGTARQPKPGEVVATIGDVTITLPELQKKLEEQSPFVRSRYAEQEKRVELLDAQVRFELLAAEGRARGFAEDSEVQEAIKKIIVQRLTREEFDGRVQLKDVTDLEMEKYFNEHKADYQKPEMVRASVITVAFDDKTKSVSTKTITDAQKQAADSVKKSGSNDWKDLVTRFSTDEGSKAAGGDLRYLSRDEAVARFGAAAADWLFASDDQTSVSAVFEHNQGLHVFKRTGKRKAIERTFDQVKNQIKNVVYREKRTASFSAFVEDLKKKYAVKTSPDLLGKLKIDAMPQAADDGHGHGGGGVGVVDGVHANVPPMANAKADESEAAAPKRTAP